MNAYQIIHSIQTMLGVIADGDFGPKSQLAFTELLGADPNSVFPPVESDGVRVLPSKLPWSVKVDGDDLVVTNIMATCFGGRWDKGDNGQTESGLKNDGTTTQFLVALPICSSESATKDSPLSFTGEHIPWSSIVRVWKTSEGESTAKEGLLADNGPDVQEYPDHALDMNPNMVLAFYPDLDPKQVANTWSGTGFSYRILGAAKYVS